MKEASTAHVEPAAVASPGKIGEDASQKIGEDAEGDDPDAFVPDPLVCREFGIDRMTLFRWDAKLDLGFPPPIIINGRKFRSRRMLESFKARALRAAIAAMNDPGQRHKRRPEQLNTESAVARRIENQRKAAAQRAQHRATAAR
jgi:hypothetical protein